MSDLLLILWLPVTIGVMAVTWVFALGAIGRVQSVNSESRDG